MLVPDDQRVGPHNCKKILFLCTALSFILVVKGTEHPGTALLIHQQESTYTVSTLSEMYLKVSIDGAQGDGLLAQ